MGYRSDVAYTIRFKKPEHFALFIAEAKAQEYGDRALSECQIDDSSLRIDFHALDVKWYDTYDDVQCHMNLIDQAREWVNAADYAEVGKHGALRADVQLYKLGYIFARVGEDTQDIEEECGGDYDWDWLSVKRSLNADWDVS